jgi:hypothetical protein
MKRPRMPCSSSECPSVCFSVFTEEKCGVSRRGFFSSNWPRFEYFEIQNRIYFRLSRDRYQNTQASNATRIAESHFRLSLVPESSHCRVHIFFPCVIYIQYPFIMSPKLFLLLNLNQHASMASAATAS